MNDLKNKYLTIGEFSKICEVPRKTLIFYDNLGIFSPEYKNDKGYRFYSINQYDTFAILLELREMGMSLEEIKCYLDTRTPENYIEMLEEEKHKIKKKIKKLELINEVIGNKIKVSKLGIVASGVVEPYIKMMEEEYLIISDIKAKSEKEITLEINDFINYCVRNNIYKGYPIGAIVSKDFIIKEKYSDISKFFMKIDSKIDSDKLIVKKKGKYACINHKGSYESTYKSYKILVDFIEENGYKIIGDSYERCLLDFFGVKSEEGYISEISIPIKSK